MSQSPGETKNASIAADANVGLSSAGSRFDWMTPTIVGILCALFMALARAAAGATLGLLFAGVAMLALSLPRVATAASRRAAFSPALVAVAVISTFWLGMIPEGAITLDQWAACVSIAGALAAATAGLAWMLSRFLDGTIAAAVVTLLAILWLTWPIWLSGGLLTVGGESLAAKLVFAHPLFAINGLTYDRLGVWTQSPLMYDRLTVLGQDVSYQLPKTAWPCVVLHGLIGAGAILLGSARDHRSIKKSAT